MSSPTSSPTYTASARRSSQYKATITPLLSSSNRKKSFAYVKKPVASTSHWDGSFMRGNLFGTEPQTEPQNNLLRERFKQRCFERAQRAREAKVRSGRKSAHYSSEGEDFDMDMDDDEDGFINDEVCSDTSLVYVPNTENFTIVSSTRVLYMKPSERGITAIECHSSKMLVPLSIPRWRIRLNGNAI